MIGDKLKVAFRVDASKAIGTGHIMRCLTLADNLKTYCDVICFICRHMPEYFQEKIIARSYQLHLLSRVSKSVVFKEDAPYQQWLGVEQVVDVEETIEILAKGSFDVMVVDHYALDWRWESPIGNIIDRVMVIDDLANRKHDCDILLDQNYYQDLEHRYTNLVPQNCELLLGPRYALLREEFLLLRKKIKFRSGNVKRVLVFFGGVDAHNYTDAAIDVLASFSEYGLHVDIVIGAQHPFTEKIEQKCRENAFSFHMQIDNLEKLMAEADLSIGAGGTATMERLCLGLPTIALCVAQNQEKQLSDAATGGLVYTFPVSDNLKQRLIYHLKSLMDNEHLRSCLSRNGMRYVDGNGGARVVKRMCTKKVIMREAVQTDMKNLFVWRNHPDIRSVSKRKGEIKFEEHKYWLKSVLMFRNKILLIGAVDGKNVGVVRFDIEEDCAEVSIYKIPGNNSVMGKDILLAAERWLKDNRPDVLYLEACVLEENKPSHNLFREAGYKLSQTVYKKQILF